MGQQKGPMAYEKQLVALGRTLQTLREEENVDVLIETSVSYLQAEFEYKLIWIGLYDRLDHRLFGKGGITPEGEIPLLKQRFILTPGDILEQVVIQQRPVGVPDLREEVRGGEWRKAAQQYSIQGTLIFPIRYKDRCFGVALLGSELWGVSPRADEKARLSIVLGGLAAALYQMETDWQRQQAKHPEEPLLTLLGLLRQLTELDQCLEAVVEETHKFVEPTRTNVYWFEAARRYFWRRVSNRQRTANFGESNQSASGIMVSEVAGFYQALSADQIVSVGESRSSLTADVTARLMQQIRARSLLAAPILFNKELLGFLAVEGNDARIWQESEKNYVRGAAQLLSLVAPVAEVRATIDQTKLDQALTAGIAHAIYSEDDWKNTLKNSGEQLLKRLDSTRFLVLLYDRDRHQFDICYQQQPSNRRPLPTPLVGLNELDMKWVQESREAVCIENWTEELKLMDWRSICTDLGARSLVACSTSLGRPLEGLLVAINDNPRAWNIREREIVCAVSQQVGLILHQWQLQSATERQQKLNLMLQSNLNQLSSTGLELEEYERWALQQLAEAIATPLAAMVGWLPGRRVGQIVTATTSYSQYALNTNVAVPIQTDALIQWALAADKPLSVNVGDLPLETKKWFSGSSLGQILVAALRTAPDYEPTGVVILADRPERRFSEQDCKELAILTHQIAWSRRYLMLSQTFHLQREELERLNWYKHRRLEDLYRLVGSALKKVTDINDGEAKVTGSPKGALGSLQLMSFQQILRQLGNSIESIRQLLKQEQWRLHIHPENISLASLLRRSLDRIGPLLNQHQLWSQVHSENQFNIRADLVKIEWVIYELLFAAIRRSQAGGRIDIWCRPLDSQRAEVSIVDTGTMPPLLIADLQTGRPADLLAPSSLDRPPGRHLAICQRVVQQMGGELYFSQMEDGRTVSQLILPLVNG